MPLNLPAAAARNVSSCWMSSWARGVEPAFTTAIGRCSALKQSNKNLWPGLAGLPAKIPKRGDWAAPANEERNRESGALGWTPKRILCPGQGAANSMHQHNRARATMAREDCGAYRPKVATASRGWNGNRRKGWPARLITRSGTSIPAESGGALPPNKRSRKLSAGSMARRASWLTTYAAAKLGFDFARLAGPLTIWS